MKPLPIKSERELLLLFQVLTLELALAKEHLDVLTDLEQMALQYPAAIAESGLFWGATQRAHEYTALIRLAKVFDSDTGAVSLTRLLKTIQEKKGWFSEESFKARTADRQHASDLARARLAEMPSGIRAKASADEQLILQSATAKKLKVWRDESLAHLSPDVALGKTNLAQEKPLTHSEMKELATLASEILNRYRHYFDATYSGTAFRSDLRATLSIVQEAIDAQKRSIQATAASLTARPSGFD